MELFHEYKNKYFHLIFTILSLAKDGITEEEIIKLIQENGYNDYEFVDKNGCTLRQMILNKCYNKENNLNLLKEENGKYYPIITEKGQAPLKVKFTSLEKQWLKDLISNEKARTLLEKDILNKLEESLKDVKNLSYGNIDITNNIISLENVEDKEFRKKFFVILKGIVEHRYIKYTNIDKNGKVYKNQKAIPVRIEYSLKDDKFRVSFYSVAEKRPIMAVMDSLSEISLEEKIKEEVLRKDILTKIKDKYVDEPIILQVKDERSAMERFFMSFSSYERYARVIEKDVYEIELYYYSFQKEEIIRKIISLGPYVKVKSPENIVETIMERITCAYNLSL